ncbi:shikimate dehydrogenase [Dysgonomonas sp. ZJ709]|uniref:shikimate dehydrogenase family protein n=1 Tax=Dysgonomonas sp. ZJ709 TaxID=2709797 RepID=UPI0013ED3D02|nr:shikimate dehydrogenase [Dysgonomonas sp. ZJ709]
MNKYGLIGYPLKHSFSQRFFTEKFAKENIEAAYLNFEIPQLLLFPDIIKSHPDLKGLNVTIPYKEDVMQFLDELDIEAEAIGAVNVIKFDRSKGGVKLIGYNSDIIGFQNSIFPLIKPAIHRKALVLGTGGASKAVVRALQNLNIQPVYVSRTKKEGAFIYQDLSEKILTEYTVIINASPLGTFPNVNEAPDIPYQYISTNHLVYDLVYNPEETKFLKLAKENGAIIKNGAEMLELQALAAWEIWNR